MAGEGVIWKLQRLVCCQVGPVLRSFNKEEEGIEHNRLSLRKTEEAV